MHAWHPKRQEEDIGTPGTRITVRSHHVGAGNHTRVLCNPALNGQVISSVPILSNLRFFPFLTMKSEATRVVSKLWRGPAHSFSFSSHFLLILTSPARSVSLEERLSAFETEQSFLFLGDLHILFLAPGGSMHLSAVNSQSLTSFPVSVGSVFGCAHSLLSGDGSSHKDISCRWYPVSESDNGCFQGCPNISKLLPKHKAFSFLFSTTGMLVFDFRVITLYSQGGCQRSGSLLYSNEKGGETFHLISVIFSRDAKPSPNCPLKNGPDI